MSEEQETTLEIFERALAAAPSNEAYRLRLFVSGSTARSARAVSNIKAICERHLAGRYELDIVDLFQQPELAKDAQIIAAPTLVKEFPIPSRKIVGDMSDEGKVLISLDLQRINPLS